MLSLCAGTCACDFSFRFGVVVCACVALLFSIPEIFSHSSATGTTCKSAAGTRLEHQKIRRWDTAYADDVAGSNDRTTKAKERKKRKIKVVLIRISMQKARLLLAANL